MIHHDTSMYGGPLSSFVFPHFPGTCGRQKARHNTFRWISFHWAMNSYDYGNWQTTTRCCRWQSLQCSKSSKERCQLAVAAEALATSPWQNSTSMFANQPTENKYLNYLNRYLLETKKTVWLDCHIPLHIAPVVLHLAVLGPRCCDEGVFARLELVALHLIEESQHLVTFVTYVTNDNQLSARVATGQTMESHSLTNNWHTGHS